MRCPAADRVVLAAYQLRGIALEWWRLKMQTTFVGRTEEAITWSKFLDVPKSGWTIVERMALPNCARKRRDVVQFSWELAEGSVRARRTSHDRRPAQGRAVAVQGQYLQRCSSSCVVPAL
ncbi:hypothetical protein Taro_007773 [Colocasia esculenta]|uniref:Retrotransposon gag domain-containing protein n=1 Tax=Colocasia esculenta TaxID=4460 RepID=A0A843TS64_COLES|nr:hypothetical protein [Colocasia esculenta]